MPTGVYRPRTPVPRRRTFVGTARRSDAISRVRRRAHLRRRPRVVHQYRIRWGIPGVAPGNIKILGELTLNGTFETDITGWIADGAATISRSTADFHSGVASLKVAGANLGDGAESSPIPCHNLTDYTLTCWIKGTAGRHVECGMGNAMPTDALVVALTGAWQLVVVSGTTDAVQPNLAARFLVSDGSTPFDFWVDDVIVSSMNPRLSWAISGAVVATKVIAATTNIIFTEAATLVATKVLTPTTNIVFSESATLVATKVLQATTHITFTVSATLTKVGGVARRVISGVIPAIFRRMHRRPFD